MPFRDICGHRRTLELLARAVATESLPPSLIFTGPEGIGKRTAAMALAQALNCLGRRRDVPLPPDAAGHAPTLRVDACGECAACRRIARGIHPDVVSLTPDDDKVFVSIEQVRAVNEQVAYRPFEARRRVVIVDNAADVLPPIPQNALLKTLEEPPAGTVFVLVAAHAEGLLPTVRSRCHIVRFAPLTTADLAQCLATVHGLDAASARTRAAVADGSVSAALASANLEDVRAAAHRALERIARARDPRGRLEATRHMVGRSPKGSGLGERDSLALHLRLLHSLVRDVSVLSTGGDERVLAHADLRQPLAALSPAFDAERLVRAFSAIDRALTALDRNAGPKIVADWVTLQI